MDRLQSRSGRGGEEKKRPCPALPCPALPGIEPRSSSPYPSGSCVLHVRVLFRWTIELCALLLKLITSTQLSELMLESSYTLWLSLILLLTHVM